MSTNNVINLKHRRILVTGANGFIGQNLVVRLSELDGVSILTFVRGDDAETLPQLLSQVDCVVHLAGENRPYDPAALSEVNVGLTNILCNAIRSEHSTSGRSIPLLLASSTQAEQDNPYGQSKLAAEQAVEQLATDIGSCVHVFRLPGVFGKWCKPNYNSVVATFCYNIARSLPIKIHDPRTELCLVYIDDVISTFIKTLEKPMSGFSFERVEPEYSLTLEKLANHIQAFNACRTSLMVQRVGTGFLRALYATYVSYLPPEAFSYAVKQYSDQRGIFVEMLKTTDSGQFSLFTAHPGFTRGGHYHHSKTEKFFVVKGKARFSFRHIMSGERYELYISGRTSQIVETVPGWAHDITNVGDEELVCMLWTNEIFDSEKPDTFACPVSSDL